jgi:hypothetical protein
MGATPIPTELLNDRVHLFLHVVSGYYFPNPSCSHKHVATFLKARKRYVLW